MKTKSHFLSIFALFIFSLLGFVFKNSFTELLNDYYQTYQKEYQPQVSYLRTDKPIYKPSETVWFQAYLRDVNSLKPSEAGKSIFVEIFDPKGKSIEKLRLVLADGQASGQYDIPSDAAGGMYKILCYSSWQRNNFGAPIFEKTFQVQKVLLPKIIFDLKLSQDNYRLGDEIEANLSIKTAENRTLENEIVAWQVKMGDSVLHFSQNESDKDGKVTFKYKIPKNLSQMRMSINASVRFRGETESTYKNIPLSNGNVLAEFFPEGGKIIAGVKNKVAFHLFDENGKAIQAEGFIKNQNGEGIARFCTLLKGLGEFSFEPKEGEKYFAEIDEQEMRGKMIPLENIMQSGFHFTVEKQANAVLLKVQNVNAKGKLHITVENGGKMIHNQPIKLIKNMAEFLIPNEKFAAGASWFSLFVDNKLYAETALFTNHKKGIKIAFKTDKTNYAPREKVELELTTTDENGKAIEADIALAVVNDKLISLADDESGNIVTSLLLEPHLKFKLDKPKDFFDTKNEHAEKICDLALQTMAKRHFTWNNFSEKTKAKTTKPKFEQDEMIVAGNIDFVKSDFIDYYGNIKNNKNNTFNYVISVNNLFNSTEFYFDSTKTNYAINHLDFDYSYKNHLTLKSNSELHENFKSGDSINLALAKEDYVYEYFPNQLTRMDVTYMVYTDDECKEVVIKPEFITLIIPSELNPTGIEKPLATYRYDDFINEIALNTKWINPKNPLVQLPWKTFFEQRLFVGDLYGMQNPMNKSMQYFDDMYKNMDYFKNSNECWESHIYNQLEAGAKEDTLLADFLYEKEKLVSFFNFKALFPQDCKAIQDLKLVNMPNFKAIKNKSFAQKMKYELKGKQLLTQFTYMINMKICQNSCMQTTHGNLADVLIQATKEGRIRPYQYDGKEKMLLELFEENLKIPTEDAGLSEEEMALGFVEDSIKDDWGSEGDGASIETNSSSTAKVVSAKRDELTVEMADEINAKATLDLSILDSKTIVNNKVYQKRSFESIMYAHNGKDEIRDDFRTTIFWEGKIRTNKSTGKASLSFYNNEEESSFRMIAEAISPDGKVGVGTYVYATLMPIAMEAKIPLHLTYNDEFVLPFVIKNTTNENLNVKLSINLPNSIDNKGSLDSLFEIKANSYLNINKKYLVKRVLGESMLKISLRNAKTNALLDSYQSTFTVMNAGFPASVFRSGMSEKDMLNFEVKNAIKGSESAEIVFTPVGLGQFMGSLEGMLREPNGCFEQTSSSTFPNILIAQLLSNNGQSDKQIIKEKALDYIKKGYNRLIGFECGSGEGFSLFGNKPASEGLTAYGLLEFYEMKKVTAIVPDELIERTKKWLISRKKNGEFHSSETAYYENHDKINQNAYIMYCLSETGENDFALELDTLIQRANKEKNAYVHALITNTLLNIGDERADTYLNNLLILQDSEGKIPHKGHTFMKSSQPFSDFETSALALLAMLKRVNVKTEMSEKTKLDFCNKTFNYLLKNSKTYGGYGTTQATFMVLRAFNLYLEVIKTNTETGKFIEVSFNKKQKDSLAIDENTMTKLVYTAKMTDFIANGKNALSLNFGTKKAIPYTMRVIWDSYLPENSATSPFNLTINYPKKASFEKGKLETMKVKLKNKTSQAIPTSMLIIGIPSGFSLLPTQLKEMQTSRIFDYYELKNNKLILYFMETKASAELNFDFELKAEFAGKFMSPSSVAYPYYSPDQKFWVNAGEVIITD